VETSETMSCTWAEVSYRLDNVCVTTVQCVELDNVCVTTVQSVELDNVCVTTVQCVELDNVCVTTVQCVETERLKLPELTARPSFLPYFSLHIILTKSITGTPEVNFWRLSVEFTKTGKVQDDYKFSIHLMITVQKHAQIF
jgi:hypothetical protein